MKKGTAGWFSGSYCTLLPVIYPVSALLNTSYTSNRSLVIGNRRFKKHDVEGHVFFPSGCGPDGRICPSFGPVCPEEFRSVSISESRDCLSGPRSSMSVSGQMLRGLILVSVRSQALRKKERSVTVQPADVFAASVSEMETVM